MPNDNMQENTEDIFWSDEVYAHCFWLRVSESVEAIAGAIGELISDLNTGLGTASWEALDGENWPESEQARIEFVRRRPMKDDDGFPNPKAGYTGSLSTKAPGFSVEVKYYAGASSVGRNSPRNICHVNLYRSGVAPGLSSRMGDVLVMSCVEAFNPVVAYLSVFEVGRLSRRRGWQMPDGYRLWMRDDVARNVKVPKGLTASPLDGGTLVRVPDDYEPHGVVSAMARLRELNDFESVPH